MEGRIIHISQKVAKSKRIGNRRKGKLKKDLICELWELQKERKENNFQCKNMRNIYRSWEHGFSHRKGQWRSNIIGEKQTKKSRKTYFEVSQTTSEKKYPEWFRDGVWGVRSQQGQGFKITVGFLRTTLVGKMEKVMLAFWRNIFNIEFCI